MFACVMRGASRRPASRARLARRSYSSNASPTLSVRTKAPRLRMMVTRALALQHAQGFADHAAADRQLGAQLVFVQFLRQEPGNGRGYVPR